MNHWWSQRTPRERWILAGGALLLAVIVIYVGLWQPLHDGVDQRRAALQARQETLAWMHALKAEVPQLRAGRPADTARGGESTDASLLAVLESSAREAGLRAHIARMEPDTEHRVRLSLREAGFDRTVRWLAALEGTGISVTSAQFVRADAAGTVNASLTLSR